MADPDGPITPADIHQMTRYATETREPAQIPAEAVDAVAGTLHRQYCPVPPSEHSPVALDVCLANRRAQAQRLLTDAAPLLIQAGREQEREALAGTLAAAYRDQPIGATDPECQYRPGLKLAYHIARGDHQQELWRDVHQACDAVWGQGDQPERGPEIPPPVAVRLCYCGSYGTPHPHGSGHLCRRNTQDGDTP